MGGSMRFFKRLFQGSHKVVIAFGTTILFITTILVYQYFAHYSADIPFHLDHVYQAKQDNVVKKVIVGLHINDFTTFSFYKNDFEMDAILWFRFPKKTVSIDELGDFQFHNGEIVNKSKPKIRTVGKDSFVSYKIKVRFKTYLNYKYFPFDDHQLNIVVEHNNISSKEILLCSDRDSLVCSEHLFISYWTLRDREVRSGYVSSMLSKGEESIIEQKSSVVFTLYFEKSGIKQSVSLYLPIFLLIFLGVFSLLMGITEVGDRVSSISSITLTIVLFRLVINAIAPNTGAITAVDYTYFMLIIVAIILLFFQMALHYVVNRLPNFSEKVQAKKIATWQKINDIFLYGILISLSIGVLMIALIS
jgi:hypothetical protein